MTHIPYPSDYDGPMGTAKCSICGEEVDVENEGHQDDYTHAIYCDDCNRERKLEELNGELQEAVYNIIDVLKDVWTTDKWAVDEAGYNQHSIKVYNNDGQRFMFDLQREVVIARNSEIPLELLNLIMLSHEMIVGLIIDYKWTLKKLEELS